MTTDNKGNALWWAAAIGLTIFFLAALGTVIYGIANEKMGLWIAGLVGMGTAVGGAVQLYGHMKGPKP